MATAPTLLGITDSPDTPPATAKPRPLRLVGISDSPDSLPAGIPPSATSPTGGSPDALAAREFAREGLPAASSPGAVPVPKQLQPGTGLPYEATNQLLHPVHPVPSDLTTNDPALATPRKHWAFEMGEEPETAQGSIAVSGVEGYPEMYHGAKDLAHAKTRDERYNAGSEIVGGAMTAATPGLIAGLGSAPAATGRALLTGIAGGKVARYLTRKVGGSQAAQDFAETAGSFIPGAIEGGVEALAEHRGAAATRPTYEEALSNAENPSLPSDVRGSEAQRAQGLAASTPVSEAAATASGAAAGAGAADLMALGAGETARIHGVNFSRSESTIAEERLRDPLSHYRNAQREVMALEGEISSRASRGDHGGVTSLLGRLESAHRLETAMANLLRISEDERLTVADEIRKARQVATHSIQAVRTDLPLGAIRSILREEREVHGWQRELSERRGLHLSRDASNRLLSDPIGRRIASRLVELYPDDQHTLTIEAAAKIFKGDWDSLGITKDEARTWATRYLSEIAAEHGQPAVAELRYVHPSMRDLPRAYTDDGRKNEKNRTNDAGGTGGDYRPDRARGGNAPATGYDYSGTRPRGAAPRTAPGGDDFAAGGDAGASGPIGARGYGAGAGSAAGRRPGGAGPEAGRDLGTEGNGQFAREAEYSPEARPLTPAEEAARRAARLDPRQASLLGDEHEQELARIAAEEEAQRRGRKLPDERQGTLFSRERNQSGKVAADILNPVSLGRGLNSVYDRAVSNIIQHAHLGRSHPEIERVDPSLAQKMRVLDAAPQYFRAKAEANVQSVVGDLTRDQERGFVLLADDDTRQWLQQWHPDEYQRYASDTQIQQALQRYKPLEEELRQARKELGGRTIDRDYLRRVYDEHLTGAGVSDTSGRLKSPRVGLIVRDAKGNEGRIVDLDMKKAEAKVRFESPDATRGMVVTEKTMPLDKLRQRKPPGQAGTYIPFDKIITPQSVDQESRALDPQEYYEHGLHEFGPSYAARYVATMLKLAEDKVATDFQRKATAVRPGEPWPEMIRYNGKDYYSRDIARQIKEARPGSKQARDLAQALGVKVLPKPKDVRVYGAYKPTDGNARLAGKAFHLAQAIVDSPVSGEEEKASAWNTLRELSSPLLGPEDVTTKLKEYYNSKPSWFRDVTHFIEPLNRFVREQTVGLGFGIPHMMNLARRIGQQTSAGALDPRGYARGFKVLFDKELKARGVNGVNDPTFDKLLRHGGISTQGVENYHQYLGGNFNPANWARLAARIGHETLYKPGGMDQRARLWMADYLRAQDPKLTDEQIAERINDALGKANRATWTDLQRSLGPYMVFPSWVFGSAKWVLEHPIRTTVPPAMVMLIANMALHQAGLNNDRERFDMSGIHVGDRTVKPTILNEPIASHLFGAGVRSASNLLRGERAQRAIDLSGLPADWTGIPVNSMEPWLTEPLDQLTNRDYPGAAREIVGLGTRGERGKVLPFASRATELRLGHAARNLIPLAGQITRDQNIDVPGLVGASLGFPNYRTRRRR